MRIEGDAGNAGPTTISGLLARQGQIATGQDQQREPDSKRHRHFEDAHLTIIPIARSASFAPSAAETLSRYDPAATAPSGKETFRTSGSPGATVVGIERSSALLSSSSVTVVRTGSLRSRRRMSQYTRNSSERSNSRSSTGANGRMVGDAGFATGRWPEALSTRPPSTSRSFPGSTTSTSA